MYNVCHRPQSTALLGPSMSIAIMFLPSSPLFFLFLFWPVERREGQQNSCVFSQRKKYLLIKIKMSPQNIVLTKDI
jgi:hypothetical protein